MEKFLNDVRHCNALKETLNSWTILKSWSVLGQGQYLAKKLPPAPESGSMRKLLN